MRSELLMTFFMLTLSACATAELTDGGKRVRIVTVSPQSCHYLGEVSGSYRGDSVSGGVVTNVRDFSEVDLKNQAAKMGADTIEVLHGGSGGLSGEAYRCEK